MPKIKYPHDQAYTRLAPSPLHGVGVFVVKNIPKMTNIFNEGDDCLVWLDEKIINQQKGEIKKLYQDFCLKNKGKYACPKSFNDLTVAWYLNDNPRNPNVFCDKNYDFFSLRKIKKGEELTIDYSAYSE